MGILAIINSCFSAYAAGASLSRSSVNEAAGTKSQVCLDFNGIIQYSTSFMSPIVPVIKLSYNSGSGSGTSLKVLVVCKIIVSSRRQVISGYLN